MVNHSGNYHESTRNGVLPAGTGLAIAATLPPAFGAAAGIPNFEPVTL